jgi:hypothetical protein
MCSASITQDMGRARENRQRKIFTQILKVDERLRRLSVGLEIGIYSPHCPGAVSWVAVFLSSQLKWGQLPVGMVCSL